MRLGVRVLVLALVMVAVAGPSWAAFCWQAPDGSIAVLELGAGVGSLIPVMGELRASPAYNPLCLGYRIYPFHGIARIVDNYALLGITLYSESGPNGQQEYECGSSIAEFKINLNDMTGVGYTRNAPHFADPPDYVTLIPIACP